MSRQKKLLKGLATAQANLSKLATLRDRFNAVTDQKIDSSDDAQGDVIASFWVAVEKTVSNHRAGVASLCINNMCTARSEIADACIAARAKGKK
ncbi:hypothetical protein D9M71_293470 [compost metagenome]